MRNKLYKYCEFCWLILAVSCWSYSSTSEDAHDQPWSCWCNGGCLQCRYPGVSHGWGLYGLGRHLDTRNMLSRLVFILRLKFTVLLGCVLVTISRHTNVSHLRQNAERLGLKTYVSQISSRSWSERSSAHLCDFGLGFGLVCLGFDSGCTLVLKPIYQSVTIEFLEWPK